MVLSNRLNVGGAERFASHLLEGLPVENYRSHLVVLRDDIAYPLPISIPVHVLDYQRAGDLPRAVWRLCQIIERVRPDVLLSVGTSVNVVAGIAMLCASHRPAWIARVDTNLQRRDLRLRRAVLQQLHRFADRIVTSSREMARMLVQQSPHLASKITSLYNPMAFDRLDDMSRQPPAWRPSGQGPLLVTAGRAHTTKRWDLLLEAFAQVIRTHDAQLALCGHGPLLQDLQHKAGRMNLDGHVHFLGFCDNPFAIMIQADLFILSSEAEGLCNALIEAQGLGICAVATYCQFGPAEIVTHGLTGALSAVNDSHALARAITDLLADEKGRKRMGAEARKKVRRQFDFQVRCRQWEQLIRQVALDRRRPA